MEKTIPVIEIDIADCDARMFEELVVESREPFTWNYRKIYGDPINIDVKFVKATEDEE